MGRKMKNSICLVIVLVLIYLQQSVIYAEDQVPKTAVSETGDSEGEMNPLTEADETKEEKQNHEENREKDGEEEPKNDGEQQDDTDNTGQSVRKYQMEISEPDGRQDYYVTVPQVEITHVSEGASTVCELWYADEMTMQKVLQEPDEVLVIDPELFRNGRQRLDIYMLDPEGKRLEEYDFSQEFLIDMQPPTVQVSAEHGFDAWYQNEAWIHVEGIESAEESQIESMVCYCENQMVGKTAKNQTDFLITQTSRSGEGVNVTVVVRDMAGNKSERTCRLYIDNAPPGISVAGVTDYMITSQPVIITSNISDDNHLKSCHVTTEWEQPDQSKQIVPEAEWQLGAYDGVQVQTFDEDGIYRMHWSAEDASGFVSSRRVQFIIDRTDPIVRYVDELNGRYMQSFQWNYPAEAYIRDFTSYTYQTLLDGVLYPVGRYVDMEGQHILRVDVVDAAGNRASAQAEFVVDHTPPQIEFWDLEDGESYEKEKKIEIHLKDQNDRFSGIRLNGEEQEYKRSDREWSFLVSEPDTYYVDVEAVDRAGNKSSERIWFEVTPEKNALEKMITPIRQMFDKEKGGQKDSIGEGKNNIEKRKHKQGEKIVRYLEVGIMASAVILTVSIYYISRKQWKRNQDE